MNNNNLDPRTKLVMVLVLSTLALIYNYLLSLTFILAAATLIAYTMSSDLISILKKLKRLIGVIIAIALVQSIFTKAGNPVISIGSLAIVTDYGLIKALEFILRLSIIIISSVIITTSTSREIVQGLVQMKVPYEIAFMVSIAVRFLPIFRDEMIDMVTALQLRGIDLKKVRFREKIKVYKYLLLPITTNSILKAREIAAAMEMRAFRAHPQRTSYMVLEMKIKDYIVISISLIAALAFIIIL